MSIFEQFPNLKQDLIEHYSNKHNICRFEIAKVERAYAGTDQLTEQIEKIDLEEIKIRRNNSGLLIEDLNNNSSLEDLLNKYVWFKDDLIEKIKLNLTSTEKALSILGNAQFELNEDKQDIHPVLHKAYKDGINSLYSDLIKQYCDLEEMLKVITLFKPTSKPTPSFNDKLGITPISDGKIELEGVD